MTTQVFTAEELERQREFPEISREELFRFFTLTPADTAFVAPGRGRGPEDQLGLAVALCTLPWLSCAAWARAPSIWRCSVGDCGGTTRTYRHPTVGTVALMTELMTLPNDEGQRVAVFNAEPGSPSESALRLLADLTATTPAAGTSSLLPIRRG